VRMFGLVVSLALVLFVLTAVFLVCGVSLLILGPILAARVAATTTRPRLERRASGPDRMRTLIMAQRTEKRRRSTLGPALTRTGGVLSAAAAVSLIAGLIAWFTGH
jgi:hypothetical protein